MLRPVPVIRSEPEMKDGDRSGMENGDGLNLNFENVP